MIGNGINNLNNPSSWKEVFKEDLDYINKYPFYGRFAESANMSITLKGGELKDLLLDVLDEAEKMSEETNERH